MESAPRDAVPRDGVLSRGKARARGPVSVPVLILGLAQLAIFALMAVLASTSAYFPFDVPVERWIQGLLGETAPWLLSAVTALNGPRQTLVGFLLLLLVVVLNPRAIVFAVLASLTGPIYFFVNSTISRPRPSGQLVQVSEQLAGNSFPSGHATFAATYAALLVLCVGGKYLRRRAVLASAVAGALVVLVFSVARIVTGGHWPSDVLGGLLLAGGWMTTLLSLRLIGDPVVRWLGDPDRAWSVRHPNDLPYTWQARRRVFRRNLYTPAVQAFERFGYVVRGLLWALMGGFAIVAVFRLGRAIDLYGAVSVLESNAFRGLIALLSTVGLAGYALWGYFRALGDPLERGSDLNGILARLGYASSAVSYTLLALFAIQVGFSGAAGAGQSVSQALLVATVVAALHGVALVYVIAAGFILIGLGQFLDSWRAPFKKDVLTPDTPRGRAWVTWIWLGRIGLFSRGLLFLISGVLIVSAGLTGTSWSVSFAHAFESLLEYPGGNVLLALLGLGLVALGLHSLGGARWIRMRPPVLATRVR
jgi:membrane-associated phospholipid phosphatase